MLLDPATICASEARRDPGTLPSRALSIRQPWAWTILYAGKRVENRTWYTGYRGPIFLHAGLRVDHSAVEDLREAIERVPAPRPAAYCGAIVATAVLVDCVASSDVPSEQREWANGPWCFILEKVEPLPEPVALRGELGLFAVPIRAQLAALPRGRGVTM